MTLSFKSTLLLFALVCLSRTHYPGVTCNHEQYQAENPPEYLKVEEDFSSLNDEGRKLQSGDYPQIRIYANYDNLASTSSSSYTAYVRDELAPAVIAYFQGALRVKYPVVGNLKLSVNNVCGMSTPSDLRNGVSADYAILFNSGSQDSNVVASSKYCYLASDSKRPLVANTNFNQVMFKEAKGDVILHEKNTYLLLHEMTHTFGFSTTMYKNFLGPNGRTLSGHVKTVNIAGNSHIVVDVAPLTDKLRAFHGCDSIPGAIMEDNGGSGTDGSHFEKKFYLYETMATGSASGKRTSEFSLALLEGSGWYDIDYSFAEPYFYGQGDGCDFIFGQCSSTHASFIEFCVGSNRGCSSQGHSGGRCNSDDKTDGCKYVLPNNDYHCENDDAIDNARLPSVEVYGRGLGSKCFTGDLSTRRSTSTSSYCFKYNCVGSGDSTQLQVQLGQTTVTCDSEGPLSVDGYYGSINCPDPLAFCQTIGLKYCPRNCMGRGTCVNNVCQCNGGFTGVDCAIPHGGL